VQSYEKELELQCGSGKIFVFLSYFTFALYCGKEKCPALLSGGHSISIGISLL